MQLSNDFKDFEQEALTHLPSLMGFARRLAKNEVDAEDLVQDTFVKAIRARNRYEPGTNLRAWLLRILRNTFINRYHRGSLERTVAGPIADPVSDGWVSSASMRAMRDAESLALTPELGRQITAAIDELPEDFRVVVLLADVEELGYREIAETLDCPLGTVMSRLHRGRKLLKTRLVQHARDTGLIAPEPAIGNSDVPVRLGAYREQTRRGKLRQGGQE